MTNPIGLVGLNSNVKCDADGNWFEFTFAGHDEKIYTFRADHEIINDFVPILITAGDILAQRRGDDKDPEPGDVFTGRGRDVHKFQVHSTTDFKNIVLSIFLSENLTQSFVFSRKLAAGLVEDIQQTEQAIALNENNPAALPKAKRTKKRGKDKPKKNLH